MEPDRLPPITLASPACPYCGVIQDPPPQRRKKCKDCGEVIQTWTDRKAREKYLLTEQEAREKRLLAEQVAQAHERSRRDARWKELSEQIRVASQAGDFEAVRLAYNEQSHILFAEGRKHLHMQQLSSQVQLHHLQSLGIEKVRIRTSQDERVCSHCKSWEGKVITVEDALEQMPIPGPNCDDNRYGNPHGGRCRCVLISVLDSSVRRSQHKAAGCGAVLILMLTAAVVLVAVAL